jgi:hypothetical protein
MRPPAPLAYALQLRFGDRIVLALRHVFADAGCSGRATR